MSEVYGKKREEATVNVVSTIPGIGYVLDVEDVDFLVFAVASLSCDDLQKMWEILPTEHRSLVEVAMRERGCPVARR
jgi:hypothetical protein